MIDWNPELYLKFGAERTRPAIDLISRIRPCRPETIIDIGCGPGNSTQVLADRWSKADITGLDNSPAMIETAKKNYPGQNWIVADVCTFEPEIRYDIVFSNAVIQWLPNHGALLRQFQAMLTDTGILAFQVPLFWDMALGKIIEQTAGLPRWKEKTKGVSDLFTIQDYPFYYNCLSGLFHSIEIWQTDYCHVLDSHFSIIEMMRSTGLKPYFERLDNEAEIRAFEKVVLSGVEKAYPVQNDGNVLLPFKRLFFIGYRSV